MLLQYKSTTCERKKHNRVLCVLSTRGKHCSAAISDAIAKPLLQQKNRSKNCSVYSFFHYSPQIFNYAANANCSLHFFHSFSFIHAFCFWVRPIDNSLPAGPSNLIAISWNRAPAQPKPNHTMSSFVCSAIKSIWIQQKKKTIIIISELWNINLKHKT